MPTRALILLAVLAGLLPAAASAADVRFAVRDEQLSADRSLQGLARTTPARRAPFTFNLAGLHWRGTGSVWFRTRDDAGGWSGWNEAMPEGEDLPDRGTAELARGRGWRLGNPWWTGSARWIQYRVEGQVTRLRAYFLWSPPVRARRLAMAETPSVIPRSGWEADESIVRTPPSYAARLRLAVVHHTAGRNDYGPGESAAIVRGIEVYHVKANGWNDIGYNFLVDRYGQVFEGRAGGVERNVVGAHAQGFNTGSVGVALLGNYQGTVATPAALSALETLLAWRLDAAHVDPRSTPEVVSGGNEKLAAGTTVTLRAISGHRDTGDTECPGNLLYAELFAVSEAVAALGLPKLYEPVAAPNGLRPGLNGAIEPILFTGWLSAPLPWSVTVTEAGTGAVVASAAGSGEAVSWTWDGNGTGGVPVDPAGTYTATLAAAGDVRPATIVLPAASPAPAPFDLSLPEVVPGVVTPNGDGQGDAAEISFALTAAAVVHVRLEDAEGVTVATIMPERSLEAGPAEVTWNGTTQQGAAAPDGRYRVAVVARTDGRTVSRSVALVVDRTLGGLTVTPRNFSPNGDGRQDALSVAFALATQAQVRVVVRRNGRDVATLAEGMFAAGSQRVSWDGGLAAGRVADGSYVAVVEATTELGTRRLAGPVRVDTAPPLLSVLSAFSRRGSTRIRLSLSEPARVKIWTDAGAISVEGPTGTRTFSVRASTKRVRLRAWDAGGNASKPVRVTTRRT